jgi:hydroxymethylglutaryl-CoA reductase
LAQNFAAVRSLVTTGIQAGHMKMHLTNILNHLQATDEEATRAVEHFSTQAITFSGVRDFLSKIRMV